MKYFIILLIPVLFSCNQKLRQQLEKTQQMYINCEQTKKETLYVRDTIIITEQSRVDTMVKVDTFEHTVYMDKIEIRWRILRDSIRLHGVCKPDTIRLTKTIYDCKYSPTPKVEEYSGWGWNWLWLFLICAIVFVIAFYARRIV